MDEQASLKPIRPWMHVFLAFILCLVLVNAFRSVYGGEFDRRYVSNLVISLMLLFNHIAFNYTRSGWTSVVMKVFACAWLVFGLAYIILA